MTQKLHYATSARASFKVCSYQKSLFILKKSVLDTTVKKRLKWNLTRLDNAKISEWNKLKENVLQVASETRFLPLFGDIELCSFCLQSDIRTAHDCTGSVPCGCGKR